MLHWRMIIYGVWIHDWIRWTHCTHRINTLYIPLLKTHTHTTVQLRSSISLLGIGFQRRTFFFSDPNGPRPHLPAPLYWGPTHLNLPLFSIARLNSKRKSSCASSGYHGHWTLLDRYGSFHVRCPSEERMGLALVRTTVSSNISDTTSTMYIMFPVYM
jgi:hypothetical protein